MTNFHDVRFPDDISFGSRGGPVFSTTVSQSLSGAEQRNINWQEARARYNVAYGVRDAASLQTLLAFFRARKGRAYAFRYKDWTDYRSSDDGTERAPTDQVIGLGDNATTTFQLVKNYVSGSEQHQRIITKPVLDSVIIALQGSELLGGFSVDTLTGVVTFDTPPANGVAITAGFDFDVPVRFDTDELSLSLDAFRAGSAQAIALLEVRS